MIAGKSVLHYIMWKAIAQGNSFPTLQTLGERRASFTASLYLCFPQKPRCQWRGCQAHPTSFLLPVSFPLVPLESQVQSPAKPRAAAPLTVCSHSSPVHCALSLSFMSLCHSGSFPLRAFALAVLLAWQALPSMATGFTPFPQVSAQMSHHKVFPDLSVWNAPAPLLSVAMPCFCLMCHSSLDCQLHENVDTPAPKQTGSDTWGLSQ